MEEIDWRDTFKKIVKIILCIIVIFSIPFILPLLARLFIFFKFFEGIEEFKKYIEVFFNVYVIIYMTIVMVIVIVFMCSKEKIVDFFKDKEIKAKYKDAEISFKNNDIIEESSKRKDFIDEISREQEYNYIDIFSEMKKELGIVKEKNKNDKKQQNIDIDNIKKINLSLKEENNNLRYYAAYNIINKKTKQLLHCIYCENYMEASKFKKALKNSYKNRNKNNTNISKKNLDKYAQNKYETILKGLEYLNILEVGDDQSLILTEQGKEFVEKYIEEEVDENEQC